MLVEGLLVNNYNRPEAAWAVFECSVLGRGRCLTPEVLAASAPNLAQSFSRKIPVLDALKYTAYEQTLIYDARRLIYPGKELELPLPMALGRATYEILGKEFQEVMDSISHLRRKLGNPPYLKKETVQEFLKQDSQRGAVEQAEKLLESRHALQAIHNRAECLCAVYRRMAHRERELEMRRHVLMKQFKVSKGWKI